jgi:hypothetical protein
MGRYEVAQALELVRALRHQLHEMTTQLARVERQGVGRSGRACAMRSEAAALRRDIREAEALIDRLNRRYGGCDPEVHSFAGRVATALRLVGCQPNSSRHRFGASWRSTRKSRPTATAPKSNE